MRDIAESGLLYSNKLDKMISPDSSSSHNPCILPASSKHEEISNRSPTVVSLFTGAGGLDLGLEIAGFRTLAAVDNDPRCIETLVKNQKKQHELKDGRSALDRTYILEANIESVSAHHLRQGLLERERPVLMAGGPPCQPFSSSGKMLGMADPRGRLFEHYVRIADELRPEFILFENVRGLVTSRGPSGTPGEALSLVKSAFEEIGYATSFQLLNAADFGCPQKRVRLFMLATWRHYLPEFPQPTHSEEGSGTLFSQLPSWRPLKDILDAQPCPEDVVNPTERLAPLLAELPLGCGLKSAGARESTRPGGHWGYRQGTFVADPIRPARTVTASAAQDWIRLDDGSHRRLTWKECARLQGFPEYWEFSGDRNDKYRQVGNAVPVALGVALGREIIATWMRGTASQPPKSAPLPASFAKAVRYTQKECHRNGESRKRVRELVRSGHKDIDQIKGLGR